MLTPATTWVLLEDSVPSGRSLTREGTYRLILSVAMSRMGGSTEAEGRLVGARPGWRAWRGCQRGTWVFWGDETFGSSC